MNQAALKAANEGADCVNMGHIEYAIDKLLMGMFFSCICNKVKLNNNRLTINYASLHLATHTGNSEFLKGPGKPMFVSHTENFIWKNYLRRYVLVF